jgi:arylsulfatase A-like enzyme
MLDHDDHVGELLNKLDELGIADNTIIYYSTDNGPHYNMSLELRVKKKLLHGPSKLFF